ncbi:MAG: HAD-IA family hydrolase [Burkholderiaceae bacterium]
MTLHAVLWDVDGTIAETERDGHRVAFNEAMREHGIARRWDAQHYGELLAVAGGLERLLADMHQDGQTFAGQWPRNLTQTDQYQLACSIHTRKNELYRDLLDKGRLAVRPGVLRLMTACQQAKVAQAIVTTTSATNVDALLSRMFDPNWAGRFAAVVCAEDAPRKKPDPQAYLEALSRLQCSSQDALAIEDSPNGLAAARAAGLCTLVTPSVYFSHEEFDDASLTCVDLNHLTGFSSARSRLVTLDSLRALHRRWHHA